MNKMNEDEYRAAWIEAEYAVAGWWPEQPILNSEEEQWEGGIVQRENQSGSLV